MSDARITVTCTRCGARLRTPPAMKLFACPRCGTAQGPAQPPAALSRPDGTGAPLPRTAEGFPSPGRPEETPPLPISGLPPESATGSDQPELAMAGRFLQNGLVLGLASAAVLYIALPEFGVRGTRLFAFLGCVIVAGYVGILHAFYRLAYAVASRAYGTAQRGTPVGSVPQAAVPVPGESVPAPLLHQSARLTAVRPAVLAASGPQPADPGPPGAPPAPRASVLWRCVRYGLHAAAVVLLLAAVFVLTDYRSGAQSVVRRLLSRGGDTVAETQRDGGRAPVAAPVPPSEPPPAPPQPAPFDDRPWTASDLVLINPPQYTVALKATAHQGQRNYQVLAKAYDDKAREARKTAWDARVPVVGNDAGLARRVFASYEVGQTLEGKTLEELQFLLRPREFLPTGGRLASYYDLRNRARRVGHVLRQTDAALEFAALVPTAKERSELTPGDEAGPIPLYRTESISLKEHVQPGSVHLDLNDGLLRDQVDFLDYCAYNAILKLQANQYRPIFLLVDVMADVYQSEVGLDAVKRDLHEAGQSAETLAALATEQRATSCAQIIAQALFDLEGRQQARDLAAAKRKAVEQRVSALRTELQRLRGLIDQENRLKSEIRSRLVRAGVPQVERSERARDLILNKVSGQKWLGLPDARSAEAGELIAASHLLLAEMRTPEAGGRYQLSMRLIDVYFGTILWEDQSDRSLNPEGGGSSAALAAMRARARDQEEARQQRAQRTPAALIGTWEYRVQGTLNGRRFDQTMTVRLLADGHVNSKSSPDSWFVDGDALVLRTHDRNGQLLEYRGAWSADRKSYAGTVSGLSFTARRTSQE
jgi:FlhB HrpN YscU SpaS Family